MPKITAKAVENIKPHATLRREYPAGNGLYLIVQSRESGKRSWAVRYRHGGRTCKLTLGPAVYLNVSETADGALTLAQAREVAAKAMRQVELGHDPAASIRPLPATKPEAFAAVATQCLTREAKLGKRSMLRQLADIERLAFPAFGAMPMAAIRRGDVMKLIDAIEDNHGGPMARNTYSTIRKVMRWYAVRDEDYVLPLVVGLQFPKPKARERILSDAELATVWRATEAMGGVIGAYVQVLLLTAARRLEIAGMRRSEIADGIWTCPAQRSKTKADIERPLAKLTQGILKKLPKVAPDSDLLFSSNGNSHVANFDRIKLTVHAASGTSGWSLHDLRRTSRSLMSRAGVNADIAERCLAHALPGMRGVYDRHRYIEEMRLAYERLATLILNIVNPDKRVTRLRAVS
jgi:integrase